MEKLGEFMNDKSYIKMSCTVSHDSKESKKGQNCLCVFEIQKETELLSIPQSLTFYEVELVATQPVNFFHHPLGISQTICPFSERHQELLLYHYSDLCGQKTAIDLVEAKSAFKIVSIQVLLI